MFSLQYKQALHFPSGKILMLANLIMMTMGTTAWAASNPFSRRCELEEGRGQQRVFSVPEKALCCPIKDFDGRQKDILIWYI
jgi:hypothetical protein